MTCIIWTSGLLESEFVVNSYFSFEYKPSGLIGYSIGPHGAAVACAAARPFLSELGCLPVKHVATVGQVRFLFKFNCFSTENKIKTLHKWSFFFFFFFLFFILRRYKFLLYKFTNSTMNINSCTNKNRRKLWICQIYWRNR